MKIVTIQDGCLYAVHYDEEEFDEYNRIFEDHGSLPYVLDFFKANWLHIDQYYVNILGWGRNETEAYAARVVEEALQLEEYFETLIDNTEDGLTPDLHSHFITLEGFEKEKNPAMKSYGLKRPSMLRVYAVEVEDKCLIIFYSGIKIGGTLSKCPILKDNVIKRAWRLVNYLKSENVETVDGVRKLAQ